MRGRHRWFSIIDAFNDEDLPAASEDVWETLEVLREVVEDWAVLKIQHEHGDLPEVEEIDLNVL